MKKILGLMALGLSMILLSGCGSDDNNDTPPVPQTIQGTVVGSHYEGVWVCVDSNSNGLCDGEETKTVSDVNGNWTLDDPQNSELNIVAEIYVDNIKHSSLGSTLVEEPMIFIASLKGEVDGELIVSPISTMVYRYMQENSTTFEVAKESVAKELGVSSETLLTNYNIENPSADHTVLQQRSDVETEKLRVTMSYHDNDVEFYNDDIQAGKYVVKDFYIPSAQDPDHHVKIGTVAYMEVFKWNYSVAGMLTFKLGREGSTHVANWWKNRVSSHENIYNDEPGKLNFAMKGDLTVTVGGKKYVLSDFYIAQGHNWTGNNWWLGSKECTSTGSFAVMHCNGIDESGKRVIFEFSAELVQYEFAMNIK